MIVNILVFHLPMDPKGLPIAIITALLWFLVFHRMRGAFARILTPPRKA